MTTNRRVPAVPQVTCVGGDAEGLYEVDVMRCRNKGFNYNDDSVQWACTASLPPEFRLGSTDVVCEGYSGVDDPNVLKGSCAVEYLLFLTPLGEERYGREVNMPEVTSEHKAQVKTKSKSKSKSKHTSWSGLMFWGLFISILGYILYTAMFRIRGPSPDGGRELPRSPWGWGGGAGDQNGNPAPPPYDFYSKGPQTPRTPSAWRPGFWSGVIGGGAAGYMAGKDKKPAAAGGLRPTNTSRNNSSSGNGEGSSSEATATSTSRYESTGFGSTTKR